MTVDNLLGSIRRSIVTRFVLRAVAADFQKERAADDERAMLAGANVHDAQAQDYVAWRRAALWVAGVLLAVGVTIALIEHHPVADDLPEGGAQQFGAENLKIIDGLQEFLLFVKVMVAALTVFAAHNWLRIGRSRSFARWAWLAALVLPLLVSAWPWSQSLDFSHLDQQGQFGVLVSGQAVKQQVGFLIAGSLVVTILPKLIALFPGIMRSSLAIKTLLPEATAPGWLTVVFAPFFVGFLMLVLCFLSQAQGSWVLISAILLLVTGPLLYVRNAKDLVRPHSAEEVGAVVGRLRKRASMFQISGIALLIYYVFDLDSLSWTTAIHLLLEAAGGILVTMVAISDITLALLAFGQQQGAIFQGSTLRAAYETRLQALGAAGLTDVESALGVRDLERLRPQNQA